MMSARIQNPGKTQRGAAAVEFALVLLILLMLLGAIVEFGRVFWYFDAMTKATRDGARLMSMADKATINSIARPAAVGLVVASANSARVSPGLASSNVEVECLNDTFQTMSCADGSPPANVRVSIVGYQVTIGGWVPLLVYGGGALTFDQQFAPSTTMRYMH